MRLLLTVSILLVLFACERTKHRGQNHSSANGSDKATMDEDLKLTIERHGDTIYKHYVDPDSTEGDDFDDSYNVVSTFKTIPNDLSFTSDFCLVENDYQVFLNAQEVIDYCDQSINRANNGQVLEYADDSYETLKQFAQSSLSAQQPPNSVDENWLPMLLLNCRFSIINTKTHQKPKAVLIEYYETEFSGGKYFYLVTPKGDTSTFIHAPGWIS